MCDCIAKIEEKIKNRELAACASFDHSGSQSSQVAFKPYTEKGDISKHFRYTSVPWKYCPFCGEAVGVT
ncbi:hypothetical protein ES708_18445 [subsurface metagenome]